MREKGVLLVAALAAGALLLYKMFQGGSLANLLSPSQVTGVRPASFTNAMTHSGAIAQSGANTVATALANLFKGVSTATQAPTPKPVVPPGGVGAMPAFSTPSMSGGGVPANALPPRPQPSPHVLCLATCTVAQKADAAWATLVGSDTGFVPGGWMCCGAAWNIPQPINISTPPSPSSLSDCSNVYQPPGVAAPLWCVGELGLPISYPTPPMLCNNPLDCYPQTQPYAPACTAPAAGMCLSCIPPQCNGGGCSGWTCFC